MDHVHGPLSSANTRLNRVELRIDRHTLSKRRWRARAADGRDFGFDLTHPLKHGDFFFQSFESYYQVEQLPEPLLKILLTSPEQAARIAWQIGNLHFPIALHHGEIFAEDDVAIRQMLIRESIPFENVHGLFQPLAGGSGHHHHHGH